MSLAGIPAKHLAIGLLIREILAPFTGNPYDFEIWVRLGYYMTGLGSPYQKLSYAPGLSFNIVPTIGSIGYPPLSAFLFGLIYETYLLLGAESRYLYYFLMKQPIIISDIGVAAMLAKILTLSGDHSSARTASLVWLYLPLSIIVSSIWGALDPITLFLVLSSVYVYIAGRKLSSSLLLGLSIFLKIIPIIFLPVLFIQRGMSARRKLQYAFVSLGIPLFGTLAPVIGLSWGFPGLVSTLAYQAALPGYGEMSILHPLTLVATPRIIQVLTGLLWVPALCATYYYIYKRQLGLIDAFLLSIIVFSISRPFLPEQWAIYPLAFILIIQGHANWGHFVGLGLVSTLFLLTNNVLLVLFIGPVWSGALPLGHAIFNSHAIAFHVLDSLLAGLFFVESSLLMSKRESLVYRALRISWVKLIFIVNSARLMR